jgi:hypothetical protein
MSAQLVTTVVATALSPNTRPRFTRFEPVASPRANAESPSAAAMTDTVSSGLEVANAATVAAMTPAGMRSAIDNPTVPRTKRSPPTAASATPRTSGTMNMPVRD